MKWLTWVKDEVLETEVSNLLAIAKYAQNNTYLNFGANVVDPFAALFEMSGFGIDYHGWVINETTRQAQKTLQNHIGDFHQNILGSVEGWINKKTGSIIDIVSEERKVIAEIKNKYNTISGGKLSDLYYSLDGLVSPKSSIYKGYKAYYVVIIPRKPVRYNKPFTPSDKNKSARGPINEDIREIDGASFYQMVTGRENGLAELFEVLPFVIQQCSEGRFKASDTDKLSAFFKWHVDK